MLSASFHVQRRRCKESSVGFTCFISMPRAVHKPWRLAIWKNAGTKIVLIHVHISSAKALQIGEGRVGSYLDIVGLHQLQCIHNASVIASMKTTGNIGQLCQRDNGTFVKLVVSAIVFTTIDVDG